MSGGGIFNRLWFHLFIVVSIATIVQSYPNCTYTFNIKTGYSIWSGTDSIIDLTLYNASSWGVRIKNVAEWGGKMGPNYDYFEWGRLDSFSGKAACLDGSICRVKLTSDGSGTSPGWYCSYVDVTSANKLFTVNQWLDSSSGLTIDMDDCHKHARDHGVVNDHKASVVVDM